MIRLVELAPPVLDQLRSGSPSRSNKLQLRHMFTSNERLFVTVGSDVNYPTMLYSTGAVV